MSGDFNSELTPCLNMWLCSNLCCLSFPGLDFFLLSIHFQGPSMNQATSKSHFSCDSVHRFCFVLFYNAVSVHWKKLEKARCTKPQAQTCSSSPALELALPHLPFEPVLLWGYECEVLDHAWITSRTRGYSLALHVCSPLICLQSLQ